MSVLTQQLAELRRRVNATGDPHAPIPEARMVQAPAARSRRRARAQRGQRHRRTDLRSGLRRRSRPSTSSGRRSWSASRCRGIVRPPPSRAPGKTPTTSAPSEWLQLRGINVAPVVVSRAVGAVRPRAAHTSCPRLARYPDMGRARPGSRPGPAAISAPNPPAFHHTIGALWLISAVARIYRPGVKADHMLIPRGAAGRAQNPTAIKVLAG